MKKVLLLCWHISLCVLLSLSGCGNANSKQSVEGSAVIEATEELVKMINANSDFGDISLWKEVNVTIQDYDINTSPYTVTLLKDSSSYATVSRYPYDSKYLSYTQINILENSFNFLGITVGENVKDLEKTMLENDFTKIALEGEFSPYQKAFTNPVLYICADVRVVFICDNDPAVVSEIFINVVDSNEPKLDGAY